MFSGATSLNKQALTRAPDFNRLFFREHVFAHGARVKLTGKGSSGDLLMADLVMTRSLKSLAMSTRSVSNVTLCV